MKTTLFATLAAALLTATTAFATPFNGPGRDGQRFEQGHGDRDQRATPPEHARYAAAPRHDDHFDRNQNYGFDRNHRVTREERRRWEAAHNYGYAQGHRVSPQESARWEAQYR